MKGLHLLSALLFVLPWGSRVLTAQALPTASGPGSYVTIGAGVSNFQTDYGHYHAPAAMLYIDANPTWRWGFESEARFVRGHNAEQVTESTYLGGLRVGVWPRPRPWNPYIKFLAGAGQVKLPFNFAHGGFLAYAPGAGLDLSVNDRISLRIIDVEYQHWSDFPYGTLHPYGVSAGLSVRLNRVSRFPKGTRARQ